MLKSWCVMLLFVATAAQAAEAPKELPRVGPWHVDYGQDRCDLGGVFGTGLDRTLVRFSKFSRSDAFELTIFTQKIVTSEITGPATVTFQPGQPARKASVIHARAGEQGAMMLGSQRFDGADPSSASEPPTMLPEAENRIDRLLVTASGRKLAFQLGPMGPPMAALRKCISDLERHWGFDPAQLDRLSRLPVPIGRSDRWVNSGDYPQDALAHGRSGAVTMRVDIDASGRIAACHILAQTDPPEFGDAVCRAVQRRGAYHAGLDAEGKPIATYAIHRLNFLIR